MHQQPEVQLKNQLLGDIYGWIVSAPMLIYGYSLAMSPANNPKQMMNYYHVDFNQNLMISLFNGFFAAGGMTGSYFIEGFLRFTTKRKSFYLCMILIMVSCGLGCIPTIETLLISRFLLGLGCGFAMIIGGIYIRQTYHEKKRRTLGSVYSVSKMLGSQITLSLSAVLVKCDIDNVHLYVWLGVGILAFIKLILVKFVLPQLAFQMLMTKNELQLNSTLKVLYSQDDIPKRIEEIKKFEQQLAIPLDTKDQNTRHRKISAVHCGFLRQFCGVPFFIVYSSQMLVAMHSPVADQGNLMGCSWRLASGFIGIWIVSALNRSKLIVFTTIFGAVLSFFVALFNGLEMVGLTIASLIVYILPTASCLEIIAWYYPFQCTRPLYGKFAAFFSWFGMGCLIIIPPYITAAMPNNQSYPAFIFFGVYLMFSIIINKFYLVDVNEDEEDKHESAATNIEIKQNPQPQV